MLGSYNTTAAGGRSEFRDVDRDLSGADTDRETVDEATDDEHTDVLSGAGDDGTNDPDGTADLNSPATTELIRKVTRDESTDERATRHTISSQSLKIQGMVLESTYAAVIPPCTSAVGPEQSSSGPVKGGPLGPWLK